MSPRELAIRFEKGRVMRDSLVQQIDRLQQILFPALGEAGGQKKVFRAAVKIKGGDIRSWRALDSQFLSS